MPVRGHYTSDPQYGDTSNLAIPSAFTVAFWHRNVNRAAGQDGGSKWRYPFSWASTNDQGISFTWIHNDAGDEGSFQWYNGSTYDKVQSATRTQNTVCHRAVTKTSGGLVTAYTNGTSDGSVSSTNVVDTGTERVGLFGYYGGQAAEYDDSDMSHVAIWNVDLTQAELEILAAGYSPLFVRPQSLIRYWPLWNTSSLQDVRNGNTFTGGTNATTAPLFHPFIAPSQKTIVVPSAAVAVTALRRSFFTLIGVS